MSKVRDFNLLKVADVSSNSTNTNSVSVVVNTDNSGLHLTCKKHECAVIRPFYSDENGDAVFNYAVDEKQLAKNKSIILSMTRKERQDPDIIKGSHKKRIAAGSGTSIQDVNILLKQFNQSKEMMKQFSGKKKGGFRFPF